MKRVLVSSGVTTPGPKPRNEAGVSVQRSSHARPQTSTQLDEQCLLYADVVHKQANNSNGNNNSSSNNSISTTAASRGVQQGGGLVAHLQFGSPSVCEYSLAVSALFSLIYSLAMVGVYLYGFRRERKNKDTDLGQVWFLVHGVVEVGVVVLMLVSACTVSHGFTTLCTHIADAPLPGYQLDSCSDAQDFQWANYDISNFYVCLSVATAGSWFQCLFWLLQAVFGTWKLWRLNMLPVLPDWLKPGSSG
ncbi:hypothetical protein ACOMHN_063202 [Nucella lapillus]